MSAKPNPIRNTIDHLRLCQKARAAGHQVSFTTDAAWLVNQAINRRAGWPDDPSCYRGSCRPVRAHAGVSDQRRDRQGYPVGYRQGAPRFVMAQPDALVYPRKAIGKTFGNLVRLARSLNTPRLIVREREVPKRWLARLTPGRIMTREEEAYEY